MERRLEMEHFIPESEKSQPETVEPQDEQEKPAGLSPEAFDEHWRTEEKRWDTMRLLSPEIWGKEVGAILRPEDIGEWDKATRSAYAETLGRIFASMGPSWGWTALSFRRRQSEGEYRRLVGQLSPDEVAKAEQILRFCAMLTAHQRDTNSTGDLRWVNVKYLREAREAFEAAGDPETAELLVNPFRLAPGQRLQRYDTKTQQIAAATIMDIDVTGDGAVIVGEDQLYDLPDLNTELALGEWMTDDADNVFGGKEMINEEFTPFAAGSSFDLDTTPLASHEQTHELVEITGSNREELERKHGEAWMMFATRHQDVFTVDIRSADGREGQGLDFHRLRAFKPESEES
jgi:hypothetical protein